MTKTTAFIELGFIRLDRRRNISLVQQLYEQLREAIMSGQLKKGHRLPSTRLLAKDLGVSRMTVVNAFDQLTLEGYLSGSVGRGTYVSEQLPEEKLRVKCCATTRESHADMDSERAARKLFSRQGRKLFAIKTQPIEKLIRNVPFRAGIPALDEFPVEAWSKIRRRLWKETSTDDLTYGDHAGYEPLRAALADYARVYRGVQCDDDQVVIISGTQQAVDSITKLTTDPGDQIIFEDPGYVRARSSFLAAKTNIIPCEVDEHGLIVDDAIAKAPEARIAYVTPSHQYPMGVTMSIERRIRLIEWANKTGGLIFEDDYDSEYRYCQRPIPSLQGLDHGNRTIYIGSLSKVIYPSLSLGYVVLPRPMVAPFVKSISLVNRPPSTFEQKVVTEFIREGMFAKHLRRMRSIHEERRTTLVENIQTHLSEYLEIVGSDAGLHCAARLKIDFSDRELAESAAQLGIHLKPISEYIYDLSKTSQTQQINGLVFGFACSTPREIRSAIRKLCHVFNKR